MQTQIELELEAYQYGRARMEKSIGTNEEKGRANNNPYAQAIYRRFVLPLAEIIKEDIAAKRVGRRQAHVQLLAPVNPEATAYIAVRAVLVGLLAGKEQGAGRALVAEVGRSVYHEYVLANFAEASPVLFYHIVTDFERRMSHNERHRMTVFKMQAKQAGVSFNEWSSGDRDQVGSYLLEQLSLLGMVDTRMETVGHSRPNNIRNKLMVVLTEETQKLIDNISDFATETTPYFMPCVEPPKDWVSVDDGGFHTKELRRMMPWMVKTHPSMRDNFLTADMSHEMQAVNSLQRVEWQINTDMLNAVRQIQKHFDMDEILSQAEVPKPPKPEWLVGDIGKDDMDESQLEEFVQWKRSVSDWHTERKIRGTKWGRFYNAMRIATKFEQYDKLYFVYFTDFRGRKYVQTTGVSPQGSDLQKALLRFSTGKPLLTPSAVLWFKVSGANRWGYDKETLENRAKWVDEHRESILSFADDPINNTAWQDADAPLQFLAWCQEYAQWTQHGKQFMSRLAVGMDGSCNGLQNFSAMLRDELGGKATNLVPSPLPNDIYSMVADRTASLLREQPSDERGFKLRWLAHGINRSLVKRSVMTLPYGSTRFSCSEFIQADYLKAGKVPAFEKGEYSACSNYLSHPVWDSIGHVVVKAREAMTWLQRAARLILKEGNETIQWVTPSGFPAIQTYWDQGVHRINTQLAGGVKLRLHRDRDTPDVNRHKNGIAPNFVHSLDASHLTLTVNACTALGVTSLAMIHDDYGTHAADADVLYRVIREEFVRMYEEHDPLEEFRTRYPFLPETPEKGNLDIRDVLKSVYFFS